MTDGCGLQVVLNGAALLTKPTPNGWDSASKVMMVRKWDGRVLSLGLFNAAKEAIRSIAIYANKKIPHNRLHLYLLQVTNISCLSVPFIFFKI